MKSWALKMTPDVDLERVKGGFVSTVGSSFNFCIALGRELMARAPLPPSLN